jgi:hypothetical protein
MTTSFRGSEALSEFTPIMRPRNGPLGPLPNVSGCSVGIPISVTRTMQLQPRDEYTSTENLYSLGIDELSGLHYASLPVTIGVVDYEEYYELSDDEYARFMADPVSAAAFIEECREHKHDELLMQKPGWNRGTPIRGLKPLS